MVDSVPENVLKNCTVEVIRRYRDLATVNETDIQMYNRSSVLITLSDIFSDSQLYLDANLRISFE